MKKFIFPFLVVILVFSFSFTQVAQASYHFSNYRGHPPIHVYKTSGKIPQGITPNEIKSIYNLPASGGSGTIVIIGAYDDVSIEKDLAVFDKQFHLPDCTTANTCFEKHKMTSGIKSNSGWALETTLDIEWTHAIAPKAKILLVEATTPSGANLLKAVDYASSRKDVSSISMSFGGKEFPEELTLDSHFKSVSNATYFASSGDNGTGASWPASSPNVIAVGGTSLKLSADVSLSKETAWSGSGGGISAYEKVPTYQSDYSIPKNGGMRAIPDVSYDADPASGFPIVRLGVWREVGGTSAGAPQWAAINALGGGITNEKLYVDKASTNSDSYFRDIVSGKNGDCGYICTARKRYDYVTGLGSPNTYKF